jgi:hypothetical protein
LFIMIPTDHFSLIITMFFSQNFVKRNRLDPSVSELFSYPRVPHYWTAARYSFQPPFTSGNFTEVPFPPRRSFNPAYGYYNQRISRALWGVHPTYRNGLSTGFSARSCAIFQHGCFRNLPGFIPGVFTSPSRTNGRFSASPC